MNSYIVLKLFGSFLVSFAATFYVVPLVIKIARKYSILDIPDGKAKSHESPVAYLGGLAVYTGFTFSLALLYPFVNQTLLLFIGCTLLLLVGLLDDLIPLEPLAKLIGQIVASLCFLRAGLYLREDFFNVAWAIPISFFWILSIINAFNLIDVMDGLATLTALGAAFNFFIIALYSGNWHVGILLAAFMGSLLAFFYYNKPKAAIYLGDAGSLLVGGFLGAVPFLFAWSTDNTWGFFTPEVILGIPLLEGAGLIIIRFFKGIPFYKPSPDHFCHYLRRAGWSIKQILGIIFIINAAFGIVAFLFYNKTISLSVLIALGIGFLACWIALLGGYLSFSNKK